MPVSLLCGGLFSEAPFQRVWASASPRVVWTAAAISAAAVTTVVTFAGLCGLLAAWAGLIPAWVSPNLYFFYALKGSINSQGMCANWVGVVSAAGRRRMRKHAEARGVGGVPAALPAGARLPAPPSPPAPSAGLHRAYGDYE